MERPTRADPAGWRTKVAIVTGGATGLGRAIAMEFGRLGCNVAFCFVNMPGRDVTEQALLTETALTAMGVRGLRRSLRRARPRWRWSASWKTPGSVWAGCTSW